MKQKNKIRISDLLDQQIPKGHFELSDKQIETVKNVGEILLAVGAVAGLVLVTAAAPNILQLLSKVPWGRRTYRSFATRSRDQKKRISNSFSYLKQQGYIQLIPTGNDYLMKITKKGHKRIKEMSFRTLAIKPQKKWDKCFWMIIADIPVEFRTQAHAFRKKIKELGLYTLQKSVWVYPYDPRDEIAFVAKLYDLDRYITTFKATNLEADDEINLKNFFSLR